MIPLKSLYIHILFYKYNAQGTVFPSLVILFGLKFLPLEPSASCLRITGLVTFSSKHVMTKLRPEYCLHLSFKRVHFFVIQAYFSCYILNIKQIILMK